MGGEVRAAALSACCWVVCCGRPFCEYACWVADTRAVAETAGATWDWGYGIALKSGTDGAPWEGGGGGRPLLLLLGDSLLVRDREPTSGGEKKPLAFWVQDDGDIPDKLSVLFNPADCGCCGCSQPGVGEFCWRVCEILLSAIRPEGICGLRLSPERVVGGVSRLPEFTIEVNLLGWSGCCDNGSKKAIGFCGVLCRKGSGGSDMEPRFVAAGLRAVRLPLVELVSRFDAICGTRSAGNGYVAADCGGLYIESEESVGGVGRVCCENGRGACDVAVDDPGQYELACPCGLSRIGDFNLLAAM